MQAIILAAGMGKRLKELTQNNTKCMVRVNGITLIDRLLHQLEKIDLSRIIIVVGYKGQTLVDYIETLEISTPIIYIDNPQYDRTNNIYSLSLAKGYLQEEDTLLFESDVIFDDEVIYSLIDDSRDTLALVDEYKPWMDGTCIRLDENDRIVDFISGRNFDFTNTQGYYKTVNIYKFSKKFSEKQYIPFMEAYLTAVGNNEYYEQVLKVITMLDSAEIEGKRLNGEKWYEIDDEQDLDIAETIFDEDIEGRVLRFEERYGGYWRFPELIDYCYLVNPYYPPKKMQDEIIANFNALLKQYPSGMRVNSMLAAKNFGVHKNNIVIGNGAAELIKIFMESLEGSIGVVRPTFEEYPNRLQKDKTISYTPKNKDFRYYSEDVIRFFDELDISTLIIINPDNPSGNYIDKNGVMDIVNWTKKSGIKLVIDESFIDFADETITYIRQDFLDRFRHVYVVKSISKCFGVPGLRLGILASGDTTFIRRIKKDVAIWNINSFAEFYMQIQEKYKKDYMMALNEFKLERARFYNQLKSIDYIRVIPSQANYFMIEILNKYIRVAIRNEEDNNKVIMALLEL